MTCVCDVKRSEDCFQAHSRKVFETLPPTAVAWMVHRISNPHPASFQKCISGVVPETLKSVYENVESLAWTSRRDFSCRRLRLWARLPLRFAGAQLRL